MDTRPGDVTKTRVLLDGDIRKNATERLNTRRPCCQAFTASSHEDAASAVGLGLSPRSFPRDRCQFLPRSKDPWAREGVRLHSIPRDGGQQVPQLGSTRLQAIL